MYFHIGTIFIKVNKNWCD